MTSLVFVHGTGVRRQDYSEALTIVSDKLAKIDASIDVRPCLWGEDLGAQLGMGKSVPNYPVAEELSDVEEAIWQDQSRWAILEYDPLHELRLIGLHAPAVDDPLAQQAGLTLLEDLTELSQSKEHLERLATIGHCLHWDGAFSDLLDSYELQRVRAAASDDAIEERQACARALVALAERRAVAAQQPPLAPSEREVTVNYIIHALDADVEAGLDLVAKIATIVLGGTAFTMAPCATWAAARRRGAVADKTAPLAGDILLYQARGTAIRKFIREAILAAGPDVTVLAHSLGGVACVDLLVKEEIPSISQLVTVGSQAPFLYELGALWSLEPGEPLPRHFPAWTNFYDTRDLLSFVADGIFPSEDDPNVFVSVDDRSVNNRSSFPRSHSAYWETKAFWNSFEECLR